MDNKLSQLKTQGCQQSEIDSCFQDLRVFANKTQQELLHLCSMEIGISVDPDNEIFKSFIKAELDDIKNKAYYDLVALFGKYNLQEVPSFEEFKIIANSPQIS